MPDRRYKTGLKFPVWLVALILCAAIIAAAVLDKQNSNVPEANFQPTKFNTDVGTYQGIVTDTTEVLDWMGDADTTDVRQGGPSVNKPWIGIIIDDFGPAGTIRLLSGFLKLPVKVTISVIPGNLKSKEIGKLTSEAGGDLFIHLPMEPEEAIAMNERYMLMVDDDSTQIIALLDSVTTELPYAVGINNHMGSLATVNKDLMLILATELKKRGLIFYDSWTARSTKAYQAMVEYGVSALKRDVFLDNVRDTVEIGRQLDVLVKIANKRGWALGTGHANKEMLAALQHYVPQYQSDGIKFVSLSELNAVLHSGEFARKRKE